MLLARGARARPCARRARLRRDHHRDRGALAPVARRRSGRRRVVRGAARAARPSRASPRAGGRVVFPRPRHGGERGGGGRAPRRVRSTAAGRVAARRRISRGARRRPGPRAARQTDPTRHAGARAASDRRVVGVQLRGDAGRGARRARRTRRRPRHGPPLASGRPRAARLDALGSRPCRCRCARRRARRHRLHRRDTERHTHRRARPRAATCATRASSSSCT